MESGRISYLEPIERKTGREWIGFNGYDICKFITEFHLH